MTTTTTHASYLAFNFASAVGIVLINKAIFSQVKFSFTTTLTVIHYLLNLAGLELLAVCGAYERRAAPRTPQLAVLALVVGAAPAINNLSLKLNLSSF